MKLAYITAKSPLGSAEAFLPVEMLALKNMGVELVIVPRDISQTKPDRTARCILKNTLKIPLMNFQIIIECGKQFVSTPIVLITIVSDIIFKARSIKVALKNFLVLFKGVYLSHIFTQLSISHIHAHWGTTTATMAYIASKLTKIPWSVTLHRGDITENNILNTKVVSAHFVRCISFHGKNILLDIVGSDHEKKIEVIPMGVEWPEKIEINSKQNRAFIIFVPARFIPVKGHKYLIDALFILKKGGLDIKCYFYGDGPLKNEIKVYVKKNELSESIYMPGKISHSKLIDFYKIGNVDAVVLPSINTKSGVHEGVPVSLMEAMAYGIPVISTNTGGISELIGNGSGLLVEEKNSVALAKAIEKLIVDKQLYMHLRVKARKQIKVDFNILNIAKKLYSLFKI